jgi:hypothetical protein
VPLEVDSDTQEAIEDWHYWVAQGYEWWVNPLQRTL